MRPFIQTLFWLLPVTGALVVERAAPFCTNKHIKCLADDLKVIGAPASAYCSQYLHITKQLPATVTVTKQATIKTTVSQTDVITITSTSTLVLSATVTNVDTDSIPGPLTTVTDATVTQYTAPPVQAAGKRNVIAPKPLRGVESCTVSQACSCLLQLPRPTATVTAVHTTSIATTNVQTTTQNILNVNTVTTTVTDFETTTITGPQTTVGVTQTATVAVSYTLEYGPVARCAYNEYYSAPQAATEQECRDFCTNDPRCKLYAFSKFDPALARGFDGTECDLDNQPFNPSLVQCNYVTSSFVVYNKEGGGN